MTYPEVIPMPVAQALAAAGIGPERVGVAKGARGSLWLVAVLRDGATYRAILDERNQRRVLDCLRAMAGTIQ